MKKTSLLAGAAGAAAGAVAYRGYRDYYRPGPLPPGPDIDSYLDKLFERMGLPGLGREIEEDWIECGGEKLHLDVFATDASRRAIVFVPGTSLYALAYAEYMHKMPSPGAARAGSSRSTRRRATTGSTPLCATTSRSWTSRRSTQSAGGRRSRASPAA